MSVTVMARVWRNSKAKHASLLVLLAIADFCNDEDEAWPSIATLAMKARLTTRQVKRVLIALEEAGEIQVIKNAGQNGTNRFLVTVGRGDKLSPGGDIQEGKGVTFCASEMSKMSPKPSRTIISKEPSINTELLADFEIWWTKYPRRIAKGAARRAYLSAIKTASPEVLLDGVVRFATAVTANRTPPKFIPHPATWIRNERWNDEEIDGARAISDLTES